MLLQSGPIAPSSIGLWAVTFILGGLVAIVAWLVRRHYSIAVPAHDRIFGNGDDPTDDGHLADADVRFDQLGDAHAALSDEVDSIHDDVRKVDRRQELVLSNQAAIADALDVELERPRFYRVGRGDTKHDHGDPEDPDPSDD
jgi:hypothetical protein